MKIIKRNGSEVTFDISKIENAIRAANAEVPQSERLTEREVKFASLNVTDECMEAKPHRHRRGGPGPRRGPADGARPL